MQKLEKRTSLTSPSKLKYSTNYPLKFKPGVNWTKLKTCPILLDKHRGTFKNQSAITLTFDRVLDRFHTCCRFTRLPSLIILALFLFIPIHTILICQLNLYWSYGFCFYFKLGTNYQIISSNIFSFIYKMVQRYLLW